MGTPRRIDLDDTGGCPLAGRCAGCQTTTGLAVHTATALGGVFCLTLCPDCDPPRMACTSVALRTLSHCAHLDIDLDEMAAELDRGADR